MPFDEEYYNKIVGKTPKEIRVERKAFLAKFARCRKTADEMTEFIRREKPDYYFQKPTGSELRARRALMKTARNTMLDAVDDMMMQPYSVAGRKLYSLDRESGYHLGTYIHNHMEGEEAELLELAEKGPEAENYTQRCRELHRKVLMHVVDNIDTYQHQIAGKSDAELVRDWKDVYSILKLCDYENSVQKYACFSEEEMKPIAKAMGPLVNMLGTTGARIACIANDAYPVSDPKQLLTMSKPQLSALQSAMEEGFYTAKGSPAANSESVFNTAYVNSSNKVAAMLGEVDIRVGATGKFNNFTMAQTVDGRRIDDDDISREIIANGRPVYVMKVNGPEGLPVMVFMKNGEYVFGDDARKAFLEAGMPQEPTPPDEGRRPTGLWDKICKSLGLESLRSTAARQYDADMEKYELEHRLYEEKREFYQETVQLQQSLGQEDSQEKLEKIRDEMFMAKYGKTAAEYVADKKAELLKKEQEEQRKQAKAKAEAEQKAKNDKEKKQKQEMLDEKLSKVKELKPQDKKTDQPEKTDGAEKTDKPEKEKKEIGLTANEKVLLGKFMDAFNSRLHAAQKSTCDIDRRLSTILARSAVENCIFEGLDAMAQGKPASEEFQKLLDTPPKKVNDAITNIIRPIEQTDSVLDLARTLNNEDLLPLCSYLSNEKIEQKITELKEKCGLSAPANPPKVEEATLKNGTDARAKMDERAAEDMTKKLSDMAKENGYPPEKIPEIVKQVKEAAIADGNAVTTNATDLQTVVEENAADMQMNTTV